MVKIPEDIVEGIKKIAEARDVQVDDLVNEMQSIIMKNDIVQTIPDADNKIQVAWGILAARYVRRVPIKGEKYLIHILSVGPVRRPKNVSVCEIQGLAKEIDGSNIVKLARFNGWRETAAAISRLVPHKEYEVEVSIREDPNGYTGTIVDGSDIIIRQKNDIDPAIYFTNLAESDRRCTISEAGLHTVETTDRLNVRLIRGTVVYAGERESVLGLTGMYTIIDDTFTKTDLGSFNVYCNLDQLKYGPGSICDFVGPLVVRERSGFERPVMINALVHPIISTPYEPESTEEF